MSKNGSIASHTQDEINEKLARGDDQTDYAHKVSQDEIKRQIAEDPDLAVPDNWEEMAFRGLPPIGRENKVQVSIRYTPRVVNHFKSTGKGWQARMDAVLAAFVDQQQDRTKR